MKYCKQCGFVGREVEYRNGPGCFMWTVSIFMLFIPILIYYLVGKTHSYYGCPQCRSPYMIPATSKMAEIPIPPVRQPEVISLSAMCGVPPSQAEQPKEYVTSTISSSILGTRGAGRFLGYCFIVLMIIYIIALVVRHPATSSERVQDTVSADQADVPFERMTPAQHLAKAKSIVRSAHLWKLSKDQIDEAGRNFKAIPSTVPEATEASAFLNQTIDREVVIASKSSATRAWAVENAERLGVQPSYHAGEKPEPVVPPSIKKQRATGIYTPEQLEKARQAYANFLETYLKDRGFETTVTELGDVLILASDDLKDEDGRVAFLGAFRKTRNSQNLCAMGFRRVSIGGAGVLAGSHSYSLGCKGE